MQLSLSKVKMGIISLTPETDNDLWVLSQIVYEGDLVRGSTLRKIKIGDGVDSNTKVIRKPVILTIRAEKVEFTGAAVRVLGIITDGPDDISFGDHHAITIEPFNDITITKTSWPSYLLDKLKRATESSNISTLACAFDREQATFALVSDSGFKILSSLRGSMPKKADVKQVTSDFYAEIAEQIKSYVERHKPKNIIIASPGFWKDYLVESLKKHDLNIPIIPAVINESSEQGISELLRRPELKQALTQVRSAEEILLVEDVLVAIAKDHPVAYGIKDCQVAADAGAISKLLVSEQYITTQRLAGNVGEVEHLLQTAEQNSATIMLIAQHDGGAKLDGLGGVAALLRYKLV